MKDLNYVSKLGAVSLKQGYLDGKVAVSVWVNNEVVATFRIEFLWDFIEDLLEANPPKTVPGSRGNKTNYVDGGRRYRQSIAMRCMEVPE